jgi:hypothetical protein
VTAKHYGNNITLRIEARLAAGNFDGTVLDSPRANLRPTAVSIDERKMIMKKSLRLAWIAASLCAGLLVVGCSSTYYKVTDPNSGNAYYTEKVDTLVGTGAVKVKDARTGSVVTLQSSEVKEISEKEYKAGLAAPVSKPAPAPAAAAASAVAPAPTVAPAAPEPAPAPAPAAAPSDAPAPATSADPGSATSGTK